MAGIPESETEQVWEAMRAAKVRSLYFGEILSRYTKRKQWVQGISLAFSSGAVLTAIGRVGPEWTSVLAAIVAIANVWAISTNLDQQLLTLTALRTSWEALRIKYSDVWSRWYEDGAARRFKALEHRANDLGMVATTGAPWDERAVARWERFVDSGWSSEGAVCPTTTD